MERVETFIFDSRYEFNKFIANSSNIIYFKYEIFNEQYKVNVFINYEDFKIGDLVKHKGHNKIGKVIQILNSKNKVICYNPYKVTKIPVVRVQYDTEIIPHFAYYLSKIDKCYLNNRIEVLKNKLSIKDIETLLYLLDGRQKFVGSLE